MCMCVIHFLLLTLDRGGRRGGSKKSPGENSSFEKGNVPREARPFPKTRVVVHDENEPKKSGMCTCTCVSIFVQYMLLIQKLMKHGSSLN